MMEDQYGMADMRQYITGRPLFPPHIPAPPGFLATHRGFSPSHALEMFVVRRGLHQEFCSDFTNSAVAATTVGGDLSVFGMKSSGEGRWPRQETLTLLEIRSRLDSRFKEANQKVPLWDEVSRIMCEEHGYQRSGKKCREKFENLYKYYKKTKEGKTGRQDGKHYRFYRQLEALYGETTTNLSSTSETHFNGGSFQFSCHNNNTFLPDKVSYPGLNLSSSSDPDTSLSDYADTNLGIDYDNNNNKLDKRKRNKRKGKRNWKAEIRDLIDSQMKKLMDKQESLMDKMMRNIEHKEQERMIREEEWRKQDAKRMETEHKFWDSEKAWMEARDNTLMDVLQKLKAK